MKHVRNSVLTTIICLCLAGVGAIERADAQSDKLNTSIEIELWQTVKDSDNPAELNAYLERYPDGAFSEVARIRLRRLQEQLVDGTPKEADPPSMQAKPANQPEVQYETLSETERVILVQQKLYELGGEPGPVDGVLGSKTRTALYRFQDAFELPATGELDKDTYNRIMNLPQQKPWAAIAFLADGRYGASHMQPSRMAAEVLAKKRLGKRSRPAVVVTSGSGCMGLSRFDSRKEVITFSANERTIEGASRRALKRCRDGKPHRGKCQVLTVLCADGRQE